MHEVMPIDIPLNVPVIQEMHVEYVAINLYFEGAEADLDLKSLLRNLKHGVYTDSHAAPKHGSGQDAGVHE